MSQANLPAATGPPPLRSALKTDDDADKTPPASGSLKAVQIAEPVPESYIDDDSQQPQIRQFRTASNRRLSGRPAPVALGSASARSSTADSPSLGPQEAPSSPSSSSQAHRHRYYSEKLLAHVGDWLDRERRKAATRKSRIPHRRKSKSPPVAPDEAAPAQAGRVRADSIDSQSSEVSLDTLQRILEDSMVSLGLSALPKHTPKLSHRHRKRGSRSSLHRTASSDTDYIDGDVAVADCDAWLDNSKTMSYSGPSASTDDLSAGPGKAEKEREAWLFFKNEIIRIAHTLRLKGWRRVELGAGDSIEVQRLSGALTNAVYVVTPPADIAQVDGKKMPPKLLLRVYGPQAEHLIDRENELQVLKRLARKKIGPRLLGTFQNGRFEEFFNAITLTPSHLREPETSKQIAKRMRELHDGVELLPHEIDGGPAVWGNWDKWQDNVAKVITALDAQLESRGDELPTATSVHAWMSNGYVCGVPWAQFREVVAKYRAYVEGFYRSAETINRHLVFAHNDTQYGNILRIRPDDKKSPLLQAANKHKQLVVIDFEYAAANTPGLEFANHFTEWTYNYHDAAAPWGCNPRRYPTLEEQRRFVKAYVDHRPQFPHAGSTPNLGPQDGSQPSTPALNPTASSSSIVDFMLDARVPPGGWGAAERAHDEQSEGRVRELLDQARLWRPANSAFWIAWGIVQAKLPGMDGEGGGEVDEELGEDEFDYLRYAQDRALFFWGDCVQMGLVKAEELPEKLRARLKIVEA